MHKVFTVEDLAQALYSSAHHPEFLPRVRSLNADFSRQTCLTWAEQEFKTKLAHDYVRNFGLDIYADELIADALSLLSSLKSEQL